MKEIRILTHGNDNFTSDNIHGKEDLFLSKSSIFPAVEIKKEINAMINNVIEMIDIEAINNKGFDISEMTFNLCIDSNGKVALSSCTPKEVMNQSGITIKISKKL